MTAVVTSVDHLFNSTVRTEFSKLKNKELRPYDAFHIKLRKFSYLEKEYLDYEKEI